MRRGWSGRLLRSAAPRYPSSSWRKSSVAAQVRLEMYSVFNAVFYNAPPTQLQLVSPTNQTVRNSQFLADGSVDPNRLKTTSAGFGAATCAQPLRTGRPGRPRRWARAQPEHHRDAGLVELRARQPELRGHRSARRRWAYLLLRAVVAGRGSQSSADRPAAAAPASVAGTPRRVGDKNPIPWNVPVPAPRSSCWLLRDRGRRCTEGHGRHRRVA